MNDWYDLTKHYDLSFSHEMEDEVSFIRAILEKYFGPHKVKILEPACGTGRLLFPLSTSNIDYTGFDINTNSIEFLKNKIERMGISARTFVSDMTDFKVTGSKFDCAICTVDTFRHLMTETEALAHFICMAKHLKKNGLYILGLHLLPAQGYSEKVIPWETSSGGQKLFTSISVLNVDRKKRIETLKILFRSKRGKNIKKHRSIYYLRTYTYRQFFNLLKKAACFDIIEAYDYSYDIDHPILLNSQTEDAVLVLRKV